VTEGAAQDRGQAGPTTLQTWDGVVHRLRELAVQAANTPSADAGAREALATEIEGLRRTLTKVGDAGDGAATVYSLIDSIITDLRNGSHTAMDTDITNGIDLEEAITELRMQEVAYKGALGTSDRVLQPTLKDFLR